MISKYKNRLKEVYLTEEGDYELHFVGNPRPEYQDRNGLLTELTIEMDRIKYVKKLLLQNESREK